MPSLLQRFTTNIRTLDDLVEANLKASKARYQARQVQQQLEERQKPQAFPSSIKAIQQPKKGGFTGIIKTREQQREVAKGAIRDITGLSGAGALIAKSKEDEVSDKWIPPNRVGKLLFGEEVAVPKGKFQTSLATLATIPVIGGGKKEGVEKGAKKGIAKLFKERGFISRVKKEGGELAQRVSGQYVPRSTDRLAIRAKNLIKDDIATAERFVRERTDDDAVAVAAELASHYVDEAAKATGATSKALYDKAAEIVNHIAPKLTEQGRAVQAASIWGRLTPEGTLRFAARQIQKYNEEVSTARGGLLGLRRRIPELTGEQAKALSQEAKRIEAMEDGIEKSIAYKRFQDQIADLVPSPIYKKIINVWKAGLLTGLKTSGLNISSNLMHGVSEVVKDVPAVVVDSVVSLKTGKRTLALTTRGVIPGFNKEGFQKGVRYFKTGYDERNMAIKLDYNRVNFGKSKFAKAIQKYEEKIFRLIGSEDQPFYYGAKARSLMSQAIAQAKNQKLKGEEAKKFVEELVSTPTDEMLKYAVLDAKTAVFQNKTLLGNIARAIQRIPGGEFVVPFGRTPAAVATQFFNYTPAGIAKTIIENVGKGRFDQRLFAQGLGRGLTGTGVLAVGAELFKKDMISVSWPKDERERNQWRLEGRKPNSFRTGEDNDWHSVAVLGPAGFTLVIGAKMQETLERTGSQSQSLIEASVGGFKSLQEQTFLKGLNQFVEAISDPQRSAEAFFSNLLGSFIPTIIADIARATDPLERQTNARFIDKVIARIPGYRETLEPQVDILGKKVERIGNFFEVMIDPSRPSPSYSTEVIEELRRLQEAGFSATPTDFGQIKEGYKGLTPEENRKLKELGGLLLEGKLKNLLQTEQYQSLSDEDKSQTIKNFTQEARDVARASLVISKIQGKSGEELINLLKELKANKVLTQNVYKRVLELGDRPVNLNQ